MQNIDISCIQETNNERIDPRQSDNYAIFFGGFQTTTRIINTPPQKQHTRGPFKAGSAIAIEQI